MGLVATRLPRPLHLPPFPVDPWWCYEPTPLHHPILLPACLQCQVAELKAMACKALSLGDPEDYELFSYAGCQRGDCVSVCLFVWMGSRAAAHGSADGALGMPWPAVCPPA